MVLDVTSEVCNGVESNCYLNRAWEVFSCSAALGVGDLVASPLPQSFVLIRWWTRSHIFLDEGHSNHSLQNCRGMWNITTIFCGWEIACLLFWGKGLSYLVPGETAQPEKEEAAQSEMFKPQTWVRFKTNLTSAFLVKSQGCYPRLGITSPWRDYVLLCLVDSEDETCTVY